MIIFPEVAIDDKDIFELTKKSFFECAQNILKDDETEFKNYFDFYSLEDLKVALIKIQYTKYNREQDLLAFDCSTKFHFEIKVNIYIFDEDDDEETLTTYILILNSDLEAVDDFLI